MDCGKYSTPVPFGPIFPFPRVSAQNEKGPDVRHVSAKSAVKADSIDPSALTTLPPIDRHADLRSEGCIHIDSVPLMLYWDSGGHPLPTDQIDKILPIDIHQIALNPPLPIPL